MSIGWCGVMRHIDRSSIRNFTLCFIKCCTQANKWDASLATIVIITPNDSKCHIAHCSNGSWIWIIPNDRQSLFNRRRRLVQSNCLYMCAIFCRLLWMSNVLPLFLIDQLSYRFQILVLMIVSIHNLYTVSMPQTTTSTLYLASLVQTLVYFEPKYNRMGEGRERERERMKSEFAKSSLV